MLRHFHHPSIQIRFAVDFKEIDKMHFSLNETNLLHTIALKAPQLSPLYSFRIRIWIARRRVTHL